MPARLLSRNQAEPAEPIDWPVAARAVGRCGPDGGGGETAALQARIAQLETEVERQAAQSRQAGYREGEAAATRKTQEQVDAAVMRLSRTIEELAGCRARYRAEAERDLVELALAVARRILNRELSIDPEAVLGLVRVALARIDARELHRARVHPEHAAAVRGHLEKAGLPQPVEVQADASLERGGAVFETSRGMLDASVGSQLEEIERGFADLMRRRT